MQLLDFQCYSAPKPDITTFDKIFSAIAESTSLSNQEEITFYVLDFMQSHRIEPDQENYQQQLRVFMKTNNTPKITELLFNNLIISNKTSMIVSEGGIAVINDVLKYLPSRYPQQFPMRILWLLNHIKPENILLDKVKTYWILGIFACSNSTKSIFNQRYFESIKQSNFCLTNYGSVWQIIQRIRRLKMVMKTDGYLNWVKVIPPEQRLDDDARGPDVLMNWDDDKKESKQWTREAWAEAMDCWRQKLQKYDCVKWIGDRWIIDRSVNNVSLWWVEYEDETSSENKA